MRSRRLLMIELVKMLFGKFVGADDRNVVLGKSSGQQVADGMVSLGHSAEDTHTNRLVLVHRWFLLSAVTI
jgi:hypothetical protein